MCRSKSHSTINERVNHTIHATHVTIIIGRNAPMSQNVLVSLSGVIIEMLKYFVGKIRTRFEANAFLSEMMEDPDRMKLFDPV